MSSADGEFILKLKICILLDEHAILVKYPENYYEPNAKNLLFPVCGLYPVTG